MEPKHLRLALIHMAIRHKDPDHNRELLLSQIRQAAQLGASLVVAPELSTSGYSFENREDMLPYAESSSSPFAAALARSAKKNGLYICAGVAELDEKTRILYNSALVFAPYGRLVCKYRKINAECRWASAGDPKQDNTFDTPWGRMGVLICSDTYHALMSRATALRGANLLLAPANWPVTGMNPLEIWRARALENGFFVAGCNRTGTDLVMDCRNAPSGVWDPKGRLLLEGRCEDSAIFYTDLPLTDQGRLDDTNRQRLMADRRPDYYHDAYLRLNAIQDLTGFLNLPQPGNLEIRCITDIKTIDLEKALNPDRAGHPPTPSLTLLPLFPWSDRQMDAMDRAAKNANQALLTALPNGTDRRYILFQPKEKPRHWRLPDWPFEAGETIPRFDAGPARFFAVPLRALTHPELAVALAKKGGDVVLCLENRISEEQRLTAGVRTIERTGVAVCANNGAGIWLPPEGHQRWEEVLAGPGETCCLEKDSAGLRRKRFQDFIDFDLLMGSADA